MISIFLCLYFIVSCITATDDNSKSLLNNNYSSMYSYTHVDANNPLIKRSATTNTTDGDCDNSSKAQTIIGFSTNVLNYFIFKVIYSLITSNLQNYSVIKSCLPRTLFKLVIMSMNPTGCLIILRQPSKIKEVQMSHIHNMISPLTRSNSKYSKAIIKGLLCFVITTKELSKPLIVI